MLSLSGEREVTGLKMGFSKNHNRDSNLACNAMFLFKNIILNNNKKKKKQNQKRKAFSPVSKLGFEVKKQTVSQSIVL